MDYTITKARKSAIKKLFGQVFNCVPTLSKIKKQFKGLDLRFNKSWESIMEFLCDKLSEGSDNVNQLDIPSDLSKEISGLQIEQTTLNEFTAHCTIAGKHVLLASIKLRKNFIEIEGATSVSGADKLIPFLRDKYNRLLNQEYGLISF